MADESISGVITKTKTNTNNMTQSRDNSDDFPRDIDRRMGYLNRRIERLEDTQISPQELARSFNQVAEDTTAIRQEIAEVKGEIAELRAELNGKIDTILQYITGLGGGDNS
jgi:archaellum component FlaC